MQSFGWGETVVFTFAPAQTYSFEAPVPPSPVEAPRTASPEGTMFTLYDGGGSQVAQWLGDAVFPEGVAITVLAATAALRISIDPGVAAPNQQGIWTLVQSGLDPDGEGVNPVVISWQWGKYDPTSLYQVFDPASNAMLHKTGSIVGPTVQYQLVWDANGNPAATYASITTLGPIVVGVP